MPRSWLSIRVDLVEGRGLHMWPRPDRMFAAARTHTFVDLSTAIDDAFARWDRSHMHAFELQDGTRIGSTSPERDEPDGTLDSMRVQLSRLASGEPFLYVFDFGDGWTHLCRVADQSIDPQETLGIVPRKPLPYFGWGDIPDQYGRRWDEDDGAGDPPLDPGKTGLPPFRPRWGDPSRPRLRPTS